MFRSNPNNIVFINLWILIQRVITRDIYFVNYGKPPAEKRSIERLAIYMSL